MTWEIEPILPTCIVFRRVPDNRGKDGKPKPGAFSIQGAGMSVDWGKYSTPEQARQRVSHPERYGVVSLNVGEVRSLMLEAVHAPSRKSKNRAHTNVKGDLNNIEIRKALAKNADVRIVIPPEKPTT